MNKINLVKNLNHKCDETNGCLNSKLLMENNNIKICKNNNVSTKTNKLKINFKDQKEDSFNENDIMITKLNHDFTRENVVKNEYFKCSLKHLNNQNHQILNDDHKLNTKIKYYSSIDLPNLINESKANNLDLENELIIKNNNSNGSSLDLNHEDEDFEQSFSGSQSTETEDLLDKSALNDQKIVEVLRQIVRDCTNPDTSKRPSSFQITERLQPFFK